MFKIETSVSHILNSSILICFLFFGVIANAQNNNSNNGNNNQTPDCNKQARQDLRHVGPPAGISDALWISYRDSNDILKIPQPLRAKATAVYDKLVNRCINSGRDTDDCKKAENEVSEAKAKLGTACAAAGLGTGSNKPGSIQCSAEIQKCGSMGSDGDMVLDEDNELPYDNEGDAERFKMCPALAKSDLKELRQEVKEAQEKVDELEKELPTVQEQLMNADTQIQEGRIAAQEAAIQAEQAFREANMQTNEDERQGQREIDDQLVQLRQQIAELDAQAVAAHAAISAAQLNYNRRIAELEIECYQYSLQAVADLRKQRMDKVNVSQLNFGGFNRMMEEVGLSSRKKDQIIAERHYKYCKDLRYKQNLNIAAQARNAEVANAEVQIDQIARQKAEVMKLSGVTDNNRRVELQQSLQERRANINVTYQQQIQMAQQRAAAAETKAMNQRNISDMKQAQINTQIAREKAFLANKRQALSLRTRVAGGGSSKADALGDAISALSSLQSAAGKFKTSCCSFEDQNGPGCSEMTAFLNNGNVTTVSTTEPPVTAAETLQTELASAPAAASEGTAASTPAAAPRPTASPRKPSATNTKAIPTPTPRPQRLPPSTEGKAGVR